MYLHPKYGWFMMCGNYELDTDILGLNTEPNEGWESVDETTHMWEGTIKSPDSNLGHKSLVIHYNNDLSPAFFDEEIKKKYHRFLPTQRRKQSFYKSQKKRRHTRASAFGWVSATSAGNKSQRTCSRLRSFQKQAATRM